MKYQITKNIVVLMLTIFFAKQLLAQESASPQALSKAETAVQPKSGLPMDISMPVELPSQKNEGLTPEQIKIRDSIAIKWFLPQHEVLIDSVQDKDKVPPTNAKADNKNPAEKIRVVLAGQTKSATRIYFKSNEIFKMKSSTDKEVFKLEASDVKHLPGVADHRGIFAFEVVLPVGNYQIAIAVVDPEAQTMRASKTYILFLNVTTKGVEFGFIEEGDNLPYSPDSDYYSFGMGFNYSVFNKSVPSIPSEIRFSSFKFPTLKLGYAKTWNPEWRIHTSLVASPGETKTGTRVPVDGGDFMWTILNGDGIYSRDGWKYNWGDYRLRYGIRGGLQVHSVPFIYSKSSADSTQAIKNVSYMTPTLGGHLDIMTDNELSYEVFMKINVPLLFQSSIDMSNALALDGSIGGKYRKRKHPWSYGLYWYGQWLKYEFTEFDKFAGENVKGKFDILNSNIEFRVNYHY